MSIKNFKQDLEEEIGIILGVDFDVEVTATKTIPHSNDPKITFPNLDAKKQSCKLVDTCVLYVDMRRSTELSLRLKPKTTTKLYSAFVRAMTRCARHYNGHVRGIIGDRVMVLFDEGDAFTQAVDCAVLMNSVCKYTVNARFKSGEVSFGIGIDAGKMLVTKTGIRRAGHEQHNYRNLVWLGRPANVASKLTDLANKPAESEALDAVSVAYQRPFSTATADWIWRTEWSHQFVKNLEATGYPAYMIKHSNPSYRSHIQTSESVTTRSATPPILMTKRVWDGYVLANPDEKSVTGKWYKEYEVEVAGVDTKVIGGNVIYTIFRPPA
jgi:adenylate cyclase